MIAAVVVNYNNAALLERCLLSLKDQEETIKEIIVVDGGSTDNSLEIAKQYANMVFTNLRGIGYARVYGIRKAGENIILSCDSDTHYPPHYSRIASSLLKSHLAATGPIYPVKPSLSALLESFTTQFDTKIRLWAYEHNLVFRRDAFLRKWLDLIPYYFYKRSDIGVPVALSLFPVYDRRLWVRTELPTKLFRLLYKPIEDMWTYWRERGRMGVLPTLSLLPL